MWILFTVVSLLFYAFADLLGKKQTDCGNGLTPFILLFMGNTLTFLLGLLLYFLGLGESGEAPWTLLVRYPLLLLTVFSCTLYLLLFLFSMRYIGLAMEEAVQSTFGVFYFLGLVGINLFSGKLTNVGELFRPLRLFPILVVLVFTVLLPNIEVIGNRRHGDEILRAKTERKNIVIGLILLVIATLFDSLESVLATYVIEESGIGTVDYMQASYFALILPAVLFFVLILIKKKKSKIPFPRFSPSTFGYAVFATFSSVFYLLASSYNAVKTGILFIIYPIVPILGAKVFLKEKYTVRQNVCIWVITLAAMFFCFVDVFCS